MNGLSQNHVEDEGALLIARGLCQLQLLALGTEFVIKTIIK